MKTFTCIALLGTTMLLYAIGNLELFEALLLIVIINLTAWNGEAVVR